LAVLYAVWYNFVQVHKALRTSPAMAAGSQIGCGACRMTAPVEAADVKPGKRVPYRKQA